MRDRRGELDVPTCESRSFFWKPVGQLSGWYIEYWFIINSRWWTPGNQRGCVNGTSQRNHAEFWIPLNWSSEGPRDSMGPIVGHWHLGGCKPQFGEQIIPDMGLQGTMYTCITRITCASLSIMSQDILTYQYMWQNVYIFRDIPTSLSHLAQPWGPNRPSRPSRKVQGMGCGSHGVQFSG